jgi:hypothetical protein
MEEKIIKSGCTSCHKKTNHKILFLVLERPPKEAEYQAEAKYIVVQCCGCDNISFRYEFHDYENIFQIDIDEWDHEKEIKLYPGFIEGYHGLSHIHYMPSDIKKIYQETLNAINNNSFVLAGVGLRMIIEAITINKKIDGKSLLQKINNLSKKGLISKNDSDRLHAIRFLGNDAAHEIKEYKVEQILLAFEILEHVLKTLYIFDQQVDSKLEMPINSYEEFIFILNRCLNDKNQEKINNTFTMKSILGSNSRRIIDKIDEYEKLLIDEIKNNKYNKLILDRVDQNNGKTKQMYKFSK